MKTTKYTGVFKSINGHEYSLIVNCIGGFVQAFFLLTADAIRTGNHYQLDTITSETGGVRHVANISKVSELLS